MPARPASAFSCDACGAAADSAHNAAADGHRGRGNAFLNDLCDADVLVHVVDVSGSTDREGGATREGEGADPLEEVG
jgi:ribosome-binding ATPase YchF (GTP1/OBG family)